MSDRAIEVVVVAYHAPEALARCLEGLERSVPVTVVDNSSSPDVAAVARSHGSHYLDAGANLGFAAGVNLALSGLSDGADVLLLNPDAVLRPPALRELSQFLDRPGNSRVGAVSPRLLSPGGASQRMAWPFPSPARMCIEALGFGRLPARRAFMIGAVLLLRRETLNAVGLFDERFFLYAEEADWQRRALALGWTASVCDDAEATHEGAAMSTDEQVREARFHAAQEIYIRKWYGPRGWLTYRLAACGGAAVRALFLRHGRRAAAGQRMVLYLRGPVRVAAMKGK